jgi:hypothetical protein
VTTSVYTALTALLLAAGIYSSLQAWRAVDAANRAAEAADRQAKAAENSLPRSWLYVDFPKRTDAVSGACAPPSNSEMAFSPFKCIEKIDHDDERSYLVKFSFAVHNYGTIPATINTIRIQLFHTVYANSVFSDAATPYTQTGDLLGGVSCAVARAEADDTTLGAVVVSNGSVISPSYVAHIPPYQTPGESFGFFPNWIWVIVNYQDPLGSGRETGYLTKITPFVITNVQDNKYTYNEGHPKYAGHYACSEW